MQFYATMVEKRVSYGYGVVELSVGLSTRGCGDVDLLFRDALRRSVCSNERGALSLMIWEDT